MDKHEALSWDNIIVLKLDGPPEPGFDCGDDDQNAFLYERAWADQEEMISVTYRYYLHGIFAAYATVLMDGISLSFRERGLRIRYETIGATKLAQLGVDRRFQGRRLGEWIVAHVTMIARRVGDSVGCRYLSVDARPGLAPWYQRQEFVTNKLMQERRIRFAVEKNRDPLHLTTSMRLDIRNEISPRSAATGVGG
jgi:GNAT superfamily N-acetyltransferase